MSENDSFLNDGNGAMFLDISVFEGLHLLKFPKIVWSFAEQQLAVNGLHCLLFEDSFISSAENCVEELKSIVFMEDWCVMGLVEFILKRKLLG